MANGQHQSILPAQLGIPPEGRHRLVAVVLTGSFLIFLHEGNGIFSKTDLNMISEV